MYFNRIAYRFLTAVLISSVLFFAGCDLVSKSEYAKNSNNEILNLNVQFTEYVQTGQPPELHLLLITEKIYPCYNYQLQTEQIDKQSTDIRLVLEIGDVNTGGVCATALGPARARISFDKRADIKELLLINHDFTDRLNIEITSEKAVVELSDGAFTEVEETTFYRTPPYSMYARCRTQSDIPDRCDDLFEMFDSSSFLTEITFPDDGLWPYPSPHEGSSTRYKYYKYETESDFEESVSIFSDFLFQYEDEADYISAVISNWKREFYTVNQILEQNGAKVKP